MKKYENPEFKIFNVASDVIAVSINYDNLDDDLSTTYDAVEKDIFSVLPKNN